MINIFCFKWKPKGTRRIPSQEIGIEYGAEHVNKLYNMVNRNTNVDFRFTVITDEFDPEINSNIAQLKLWDEFVDLGGCYVRLKMFCNNDSFLEYLGMSRGYDRFVCMDLDMVITGNIDHILDREEEFVYYRMPGPDGTGSRFNCGLFMMDYGVRKEVYNKFRQNPGFWMNACANIPGTDQAWCNYILDLEKEAYVDKSDGIYDMRQDIIEGKVGQIEYTLEPKDPRIIMWPGPRDPSEKKWRDKYEWIEQHWR